MTFIPAENQIHSLYFLLLQLRREGVPIRVIRFLQNDIIDYNVIEVACYEDIDKYRVLYNGKIIQRN